MVIITLEQWKNFSADDKKTFLSISTKQQAEKFKQEILSKK